MGSKLKLTPAQEDTALSLYQAGKPLPEILRDFDICRKTFWTIRKRRGIPDRGCKPRRSITDPEVRFQRTDGRWVVDLHPNDPFVCMAQGDKNSRRVLEHRLVVARSIGRPLLNSETVHHINGDPSDNRLENLQLRQRNHGIGVAYTCNSCGSSDVLPAEI